MRHRNLTESKKKKGILIDFGITRMYMYMIMRNTKRPKPPPPPFEGLFNISYMLMFCVFLSNSPITCDIPVYILFIYDSVQRSLSVQASDDGQTNIQTFVLVFNLFIFFGIVQIGLFSSHPIYIHSTNIYSNITECI